MLLRSALTHGPTLVTVLAGAGELVVEFVEGFSPRPRPEPFGQLMGPMRLDAESGLDLLRQGEVADVEDATSNLVSPEDVDANDGDAGGNQATEAP